MCSFYQHFSLYATIICAGNCELFHNFRSSKPCHMKKTPKSHICYRYGFGRFFLCVPLLRIYNNIFYKNVDITTNIPALLKQAGVHISALSAACFLLRLKRSGVLPAVKCISKLKAALSRKICHRHGTVRI